MTTSRQKVAAIGECMIELSHQGDNQLKLAYAGDTYNTAVYWARYCSTNVDYITALGDDPYSRQFLQAAKKESLNEQTMQCISGKLLGLYLIRTDDLGERQFFYYRRDSAARSMFTTDAGKAMLEALKQYAMIYLSGISLAILDEASRLRLFKALADAKESGCKIYFDSNYRPALWPSASAAKQAFAACLHHAYGAFPTFDDETLLYGDDNPRQTIARLKASGVQQIVVKQGAHGAWFVENGAEPSFLPALPVNSVVDTTAAGDSFNAALLAELCAGKTLQTAVSAAHRLAACVIQHRGAIIDRELMPSF